MMDFKNYLESRGNDLSKTSEFLHYYSLPYMAKPYENNAMKHIFTNEWIADLRSKLVSFVENL